MSDFYDVYFRNKDMINFEFLFRARKDQVITDPDFNRKYFERSGVVFLFCEEGCKP